MISMNLDDNRIKRKKIKEKQEKGKIWKEELNRIQAKDREQPRETEYC